MTIRGWLLSVCVWGLFLASTENAVAAQTYTFGVVPHRSAVLTAQYWNPIVDYVGKKTGISLQLEISRGPTLNANAIERGDYDFSFSYLIFRPKALAQNYQVFLRPRSGEIRSQIVTLARSPYKTLADLKGQEVAFPSKSGFVAYILPMDHLLRNNINIVPVFGGNQEGVLGQLKVGQVLAAGVSSQVMVAFAARENLSYKVLWESPPYHDLPISVHPRVPKSLVEKVQSALAGMSVDPEGKKILEEVAQLIGLKPPLGFVKSSPADYQNFVDFYRDTLVKDME